MMAIEKESNTAEIKGGRHTYLKQHKIAFKLY